MVWTRGSSPRATRALYAPLFFLALAILNEIVWRNFSTDAWVSFKVFGALPLTFIFAMLQVPLLNKYAAPEAKSD